MDCVPSSCSSIPPGYTEHPGAAGRSLDHSTDRWSCSSQRLHSRTPPRAPQRRCHTSARTRPAQINAILDFS